MPNFDGAAILGGTKTVQRIDVSYLTEAGDVRPDGTREPTWTIKAYKDTAAAQEIPVEGTELELPIGFVVADALGGGQVARAHQLNQALIEMLEYAAGCLTGDDGAPIEFDGEPIVSESFLAAARQLLAKESDGAGG